MPISQCNDTWLRDEVVAYLATQKKNNPDFCVLDVGGVMNPWADPWVDAYVDINPLTTSKPVYIGDICRPQVWEQVREKVWDFTICTHTLEDIRNPDFVLDQLMAVSKGGFIAMPNKHQELSCIQSRYWLGYAHHRWIFTVRNGKLYILAKWPILGYFLPSHRLMHLIGRLPRMSRFKTLLSRSVNGPGLEWVDARKARQLVNGGQNRAELGLVWRDGLAYQLINGDYSGQYAPTMADLYREDLREGI
jgi:hypothetical protein